MKRPSGHQLCSDMALKRSTLHEQTEPQILTPFAFPVADNGNYFCGVLPPDTKAGAECFQSAFSNFTDAEPTIHQQFCLEQEHTVHHSNLDICHSALGNGGLSYHENIDDEFMFHDFINYEPDHHMTQNAHTILDFSTFATAQKTIATDDKDVPIPFVSGASPASERSRKRNGDERNAPEITTPSPKKRLVKAQIAKNLTTAADFELERCSKMPPQRLFQGYFDSYEEANERRQRFLELHRKPGVSCTTPETDSTFPVTKNDMKTIVGNVFDAINDWHHFREWTQVISPEDKNRLFDEWLMTNFNGVPPDTLSSIPADDVRPSPEQLDHIMPSLEEQQMKVLGRVLSDQTVEWLSWGLVRAAVLSQQGYSQIAHWAGADGA